MSPRKPLKILKNLEKPLENMKNIKNIEKPGETLETSRGSLDSRPVIGSGTLSWNPVTCWWKSTSGI